MKHQPFEHWLFEQEALTASQIVRLERHLAACGHCRALKIAWDSVERELQGAKLETPASGFARRWRLRLRTHQEQLRRRQMLAATLSITCGLLTLSALIGVRLVPMFPTLLPELLYWFGEAAYVVARLKLVGEVFAVLVDSATENVPSVVRWALPLALTAMSGLWIASLTRLGYLPVRRE